MVYSYSITAPFLNPQAVDSEPANTSYSLNYMHALELDQQYNSIVQEVSRFCSRTDLTLGGQLDSAFAIKVGNHDDVNSSDQQYPTLLPTIHPYLCSVPF